MPTATAVQRTGRARAAVLVVLALALLAPQRSDARRQDGTVEVPTATATPGRIAWLASPQTQGVLAYVIDLGGPVPDGRRYTLRKTGGIEPVWLEVWFYADLSGEYGEGRPCPVPGPYAELDGDGGQSGEIRCGGVGSARWAIVFLNTGANATFRFDW